MVEIVDHVDLSEIYNIFVEHGRSISYYDSWQGDFDTRLADNIFQQIKYLLPPDILNGWTAKRNTSWFRPKMQQRLVQENDWHLDKPFIGQMEYSTHICSGYPLATEFMVDGKIIRPKVGDIVKVNLFEVLHRTPPESTNKPRLFLRVGVNP